MEPPSPNLKKENIITTLPEDAQLNLQELLEDLKNQQIDPKEIYLVVSSENYSDHYYTATHPILQIVRRYTIPNPKYDKQLLKYQEYLRTVSRS